MKFLKNSQLLFLCTILILGLGACDDDSSDGGCEVPPEPSMNIIGSWRLQTAGATIEFQANGTLSDPNDSFIGPTEVNGVIYDQKTWSVNGTRLLITSSPSDNSDSVTIEMTITENDCDEIKIDVFAGIVETLTRV